MSLLIRSALALFLVTTALFGCGPGSGPPRPGQEYPLLTASGAWCWFGDPRGVRFKGEHDRIYAGWVDTGGSIMVSSLDLESGERVWQVVEPAFNRDDHADPSLLILPDGTVVVFYTSHGSDVSEAMYYRRSSRPEDVSAWDERREVGTNTEGQRGYTYPNPVRLSAEDGRIYLFWRGGNFKPAFSFTDDLVTWAPARTLIQSDENTFVRPYVKIATNGEDEIHFAFTDGHPRNEPENSIYYMRYRDGELTQADGSAIGSMEDLPLVHERADLVYDGTATGVRSWIWDVAVDQQGHPVIVYSRLPEESDHRYHYARWTGQEWLDTEITPAGGWFPQTPEGRSEPEPHYSGGIVLDHGDPSVVYLSRPVEGVFEIERWRSGDEGRNWRSRAITSGSTNDNVRPFVIRGHGGSSPALLWMENRYYRHYLDYDTAIRIDRAPGDSSPWAEGELTISFRLDTVDGFDPSYQTAVWLEDASGAYLRSLLVSEYLAFGGYIHEEICPRWNGALDWANEPPETFDAVTAATPRPGRGEVAIDCLTGELPPGTYYYCVQTHIVEEYNILWRGRITVGGEKVSSDAVASWSPQRHDRAGDILRDVSARYTPFPR